jgi:hypothetical protein
MPYHDTFDFGGTQLIAFMAFKIIAIESSVNKTENYVLKFII